MGQSGGGAGHGRFRCQTILNRVARKESGRFPAAARCRHAGDPQAATFYGYGRYRQYLRLRISANRYFLRRQGGSETMRLDDIVIGSTPPTELTTNPRLFYIGSPDGFFGFSLGGRLRVGANQAVGVYVGEFDVLIEYL